MTYSVPIKQLTTYSHPKVALSYYGSSQKKRNIDLAMVD